ncbi:uncharacterized protein LOC122645413 [Telopea speciosissima]|uniref:uncharacterized protein LOC122645413 n=1 Tax=Telopea speciosissima TaxID=54955 RepID=UPI001CC34454|nr:uncharacterized protein LOC122645413 [Telopea speciosissima]
MESISLICLPHLLVRQRRKISVEHPFKQASPMKVFAARRRDGYDDDDRERDYISGRRVDENMIVLRMRIQDMNMADQRKQEPPSHWMDWEKRYYPNYDSDICEAMGLLQTQLMNTRPSLVFGMMALVGFSVPTSLFMTAYHLMQILKGILCGFHLGY